MCGGGTTQTSTVSIPPEVLANYQKVFGRAEQIAEKPFQAYSQDPNAFVAGLNPTQQASLENINAIQGMASGDVAAGQGLIGAGTQRGGELQYQSLGSGQRGVDAGEQLYGQSLGSAQQGQQVGGQLFGSSLGTADRATGLATNLYGQSLGAAQQGQQIGGQLFGGSLGTAGAGQSEASNISRQALSDTDFARGTGQAYAGDAAQNIYSGIAAADPYMREASNLSRAGLGAGQQYANQALNYLGAGTQDVGVGDLDTERYMSPYLNQVVRAQQALQAEENEAQRSALKGQAIRAGAFGGDRAGVAQANLARQQSLANQATLSNILQQGYGQAQGVAGQQQQIGLGAAQANRAAQQFGAQQAASMGQQQFAQNLAAAQQQQGIGQNLYSQNIGQGQAIQGLGQQQFSQGLGAAQAQSQFGQNIYQMAAQNAQLQQAAAQGVFGQAAQVAALQQAAAQGSASVGMQNAQMQQAAAQGLFGQAAQVAALQQAAAQGVSSMNMQNAQLQQGAGNNLFNYGLQGGQGVANLGLANQAAQQASAQAQMQMGQIQQQTDQAGKTALYNQFTQQQGFPYQQAQFLGNLAMGTGALSGSTTTTNSSGGGFFSDRRLKDNAKKIGETFDGQPIYRYNYKGDNRTQIGLMAQDVEKNNPGAVGRSQGYKTLDYEKATDAAAKRGHFYSGGLVPASMGGSVSADNAYEGYARGGYASGGWTKTSDTVDANGVLTPPQWTNEETGEVKYGSDPNVYEAAAAEKAADISGVDPRINQMYQKNMFRDADPEGAKYWQDLLDRGASIEDVESGIANSRERQLVNQVPLTYDANRFPEYAAPVRNRYGSASAPAGSYGASFQLQPAAQQASGKGPTAGSPGFASQQMGGYQQPMNYGYGQHMGGYGQQMGYGQPQASGKGPASYGYQQPSQMSQFNQGYGQGYMGGYQPMQQASGKGVGPSSYQSNYGYSNPYDMGSSTPQASGKGASSSSSGSSGSGAQAFRNGGRIGYAGGGHIDPNDLAAIASQRMMELAPHAAGMPGQSMPGAPSYVSNKQLHVPKLVVSNVPPPRQQPGGLDTAMAHADKIQRLGGMFDKAKGSVPEGLKKAAGEIGSTITGAFGAGSPPPADAPAASASPASFDAGPVDEFYIPEYMPDLGYASGGLVPGYAAGGSLPYGGGVGGGGYIPEELLQQQPIQSLPRDGEQLKAAGAKASSGGGLGDVMKAGNLGYKLAPESLKTGIKSMLPGGAPTTPPIAAANAAPAVAPAAAEGLGAAAPAFAPAAEAAAGLGAAAPAAAEAAAGLGAAAAPAAAEAAAGLGAAALPAAAEAAAGLGTLGSLGSAAATGLGTAASTIAPIAAAGAEGISALLAFLPFLSDRRAKENIEPIGKTYDGQTIYRYNYKGDEATQIGLIAQEVEKRHKDAVGSSNGMKTVDYRRATEDAADRGHFNSGGLIPYRRGYADGMTVDEADLPAVGAQDASYNRDDVKEIIRREAEAQSVPYNIALQMARVESNLNPEARAKTSGAAGLYQTIPSTFAAMGGTGSMLDPEQNARAGIRYIAQNLKALGAEGEDATAGKAYLGHFLGTGGAKGVLSNPDRPISETLSNYKAAAAANPFIRNWTGNDALRWAESKMAGQKFNAPPRSPRNVPDQPQAQPETPASQAVALAKQPSPARQVSAAPAAQASMEPARQPSDPAKKNDGSFPIRPPATARGKEQDWSDFLTSKQFILPALTAIGTMGTTPTRDFGTALSAGLLGGVTSYQNLDKSLAELEQKREEIPKVTAQTDEVKMRTRALEAGLYERKWIPGIGMYLIDKSNPRNLVQITDADLKPIPGTGVEGNIDKIPYSKDSARPKGEGSTAPVESQPKVSELVVPKRDEVAGLNEPASSLNWTPLTSVPQGYVPKNQINVGMDENAQAVSALGAETTKEQNRKAEAAYGQMYQLEEMDKQFRTLPSEGFLVPGAYAKERMEFAKKMNTFAQVLGGKSVFSDDAVAAGENLAKNSFRLGGELARSMGTREPGIIVQQAVQANPGMENSPIGYERISAGLREAARYEQDKARFYNDYFTKFKNLEGAEEMFSKYNPPKMYADRAILSTVRPEDTEAFSAYAARETDQAKLAKAKEIFDQKYGKGVADKLLGK